MWKHFNIQTGKFLNRSITWIVDLYCTFSVRYAGWYIETTTYVTASFLISSPFNHYLFLPIPFSLNSLPDSIHSHACWLSRPLPQVLGSLFYKAWFFSARYGHSDSKMQCKEWCVACSVASLCDNHPWKQNIHNAVQLTEHHYQNYPIQNKGERYSMRLKYEWHHFTAALNNNLSELLGTW